LLDKEQQEFNEEEFFSDNDEFSEDVEDAFEVVENPDQAQEVNEQIEEDEELVEVQDKVFFGFDSSSLSADAKKVADLQALWLKENPDVNITIEGHCDERGTREYNISLGAKRAEALKDYFINKGVDSIRINTISYGEERPHLVGVGAESWSKNRRAVVVEK